jgi:hypothetical protein
MAFHRRDGFRPAAARYELGRVLLDGGRVQFGQPGRLGPRPGLLVKLLDGRAVPPRQGPFQLGQPVRGGTGPGQGPVKQLAVDVGLQPVTDGIGPQDLGTE